MAKEPRLQIFLDRGGQSVPFLLGECIWVQSQRVAAFEWGKAAIDAGLPLSPLLMKPEPGIQFAMHHPFEGVHALFSDSIPDGFGLRLMNQGLRAAGYSLDAVNPVQRLAWIGDRGVGAITYKPATGSNDTLITDVFNAAEMAAKIQEEDFKDIPLQAIRAGGSALGARPKFWAAVDQEAKKVILGDSSETPLGFTSCLLKFAPLRGDSNEPFYEAACLELAEKYGISAAHGRLLHHAAGAVLAVERFDRLPGEGRLHVQSVAALLGINFREPVLDYDSLAKLANRIGGEAQVERLYRQLCFNVALHMRDDHAKNFAFLMNEQGAWELSPAFDLCPSDGFGLTQEHTTSVNGKGRDISHDDLVAFAQSHGLSNAVAHEGIECARAAAAEFGPLAISMGASKAGVKDWNAKLKSVDQLLRTVSAQASSKDAGRTEVRRQSPR